MLARLFLSVVGAKLIGAVRRPQAASGPQASLFEPLPNLIWDEHVSGAERFDGTLTVPLDPQDAEAEDMPKLKLRIRMRPAPVQPAPLGTVLVHCGGPGSDKSCVDQMAASPEMERIFGPIDSDLSNNFNIIAIDQRSIGESEPRLGCPSNSVTLPPLGSNPTVTDFFTDCPCAGAPTNRVSFQSSDDAHLLKYFTELEEALDACYASPHLLVGGVDGTDFNVVDYIGTTYLAHDLNTLRMAIGADKLSIFGISYGTWVGAVYASIYPEFTDKVVIIGNLPPAPNAHDFSRDYAMNHQMVVAEFFDRCRKYVGADGKPCMTRDPEAAFNELTTQFAEGLWSVPTDFGTASLTPEFVTGRLHNSLRDETHQGASFPDHFPLDYLVSYKDFGRWLDTQLDMSPEERQSFVESELDYSCELVVSEAEAEKCVDKDGNNLASGWRDEYYCPTWKQYGVCYGGTSLPYTGVMSGDTPSHLMPSGMVDMTKRLGNQFGVIGRHAGFIMDAVALWPGKSTYPGIGSAAKPLIMATLEDSATGFKWTQEMKMAFPFGHLMSFQGYYHGFPSPFQKRTEETRGSKGEWACFVELQEYMYTGVLPRNGFVCHVERFGVDPGNPAARSLLRHFSFLAGAPKRPRERLAQS